MGGFKVGHAFDNWTSVLNPFVSFEILRCHCCRFELSEAMECSKPYSGQAEQARRPRVEVSSS